MNELLTVRDAFVDLLAQAQVAGAADLDTAGRLRLWPQRHGSDGFFAATWQRR